MLQRPRTTWGRIVLLALPMAVLLSAAAPALAQAEKTGLVAFGENAFGDLGNGETSGSSLPKSVCKPGSSCSPPLTEVVEVAAGLNHSLALLANGHVLAWGRNQWGQLGNGKTENSSVPVAVCAPGQTSCTTTEHELTEVRAIAAGYYHSVALLNNGHVVSWGDNEYGQLGIASYSTSSDVPVEVSSLSEVTGISAGAWDGLAVQGSGHVKAWGDNEEGTLGNGHWEGPESCGGIGLPCSRSPVEVTELSTAVAVSAGDGDSLALLRNGHVDSWGYNHSGQLGDGNTTNTDHPVEVSSLTGVTNVSAGDVHNLALLNNGHVKAWGYNGTGCLGIGNHENKSTPTEVPGLSGVVNITAGWDDSLAVLESNKANESSKVEAWGWNHFGELGDGEAGEATAKSSPTEAKELKGVGVIATGGEHTLAYNGPTYAGFTPTTEPPAFWRAYANKSVWGRPITSTEATAVLTNSGAYVSKITEAGTEESDPANLVAGQVEAEGFPEIAHGPDFGHPVYWAATGDPLYKLKAIETGRGNPLTGEIHVPAEALPADGGFFNSHTGKWEGDQHMAIVQPNGEEFDLWQAHKNDSTHEIEFSWGSKLPITGEGFGVGRGEGSEGGEATAADFGLAAGIIRPQELEHGEINHPLFIAVSETSGIEWPAAHKGSECSEHCTGTPPKIGQRLYFKLTEAQVKTLEEEKHLELPPWMKTILTVLHKYGGYIGDTSGPNEHGKGTWGIAVESPASTLSFKAQYEREHASELEHKSETEKEVFLAKFDDPLKSFAETEHAKPHNRITVAHSSSGKAFYEFRLELEPSEEPLSWPEDLAFIAPPAH